MNRLPPEKVECVIELAGAGASLRRIQNETGVWRGTVRTVLARLYADRHETVRLLDALDDAVFAARGFHLVDAVCDAFCTLDGHLRYTCPVHPEADPERDFDQDDGGGCLLCGSRERMRARGLEDHHARRKAAGRPIVPPRRRPTPVPATIVPTPRAIAQRAAIDGDVRHEFLAADKVMTAPPAAPSVTPVARRDPRPTSVVPPAARTEPVTREKETKGPKVRSIVRVGKVDMGKNDPVLSEQRERLCDACAAAIRPSDQRIGRWSSPGIKRACAGCAVCVDSGVMVRRRAPRPDGHQS